MELVPAAAVVLAESSTDGRDDQEKIVRYAPTILVPLPTSTTHIPESDIVTRAFRFECNSKELLLLVLVPLLLLVPSAVLADPLGRSPTPAPGGMGVRPKAVGPILGWDSAHPL